MVLSKGKSNNVYNVAYELGKHYLDNIEPVPNFAVMFDIDDTLLSVNEYKPIKPIIKLIKECNKKGILVLIITARDSKYTNDTIEDLADIGIYPRYGNNFQQIKKGKGCVYYDYLYLRNSPRDDHLYFKSDVKQKLAKEGIYTIMSIGDNEIDVIGDYSGYFIKLPNVHDNRLFHKDEYGNLVNVKLI